MSTVKQAYGANIAFIEELHEKFLADPSSVSASWREFFEDYVPQVDEEEVVEERVAVAAGSVEGGRLAPPPPPRRPKRPPLHEPFRSLLPGRRRYLLPQEAPRSPSAAPPRRSWRTWRRR
jgi:hypothetical protein